MKTIGKYTWAFSAGCIPFASNGEEPELTSHDKIAILNSGTEEATLELTIFYEDGEPVGEYEIKVKGQRVRKIRFNDLIDPLAMQLGRNFGCMIKSDKKVVIQFSRADTGSKYKALIGTLAHFAD